jgi:hypothetical protein
VRGTLLATAAAAASALALGTTVLPSGASAAPERSGSEAGYIVVLDDSAVARAVAQAHADRFGLDLGHVYSSALQGYAATMSPRTAAVVEALPGVDFVQEDRPVAATAQSTPTGIGRSQADVSPTAAINGLDQRVDADVAVIDTGVDLDHPTSTSIARAPATAPPSPSAPTTTTATAPTSPVRSARSTTPPAWSVSPRVRGSGRSRC